MTETLVGRTLMGGLRVLDSLGETSLGPLYYAEYPAMYEEPRLEVALVVLERGAYSRQSPVDPADHAWRSHFYRAWIQDANVAAIHGMGETAEGVTYIATELLRGQTLSQVLTTRVGFPLAKAVELITQAAAGVAAIHEAGIVHGNLSPDNIFVTSASDGRPVVKLSRFELVPCPRKSGTDSQAEQIVGAAYASPERLAGHPPDEQSDVFSLGAILYHLLTGAPPGFGSPDVESIPKRTGTVVLRALALVPAERFHTVAEFVCALNRVGSLPARARTVARRGAAAAALLLVAAGLWLVWSSQRARPHAARRPLGTGAKAQVTAAIPESARTRSSGLDTVGAVLDQRASAVGPSSVISAQLPETAIGSSTLADTGALGSAQPKAETGPLEAQRVAASAGQPIEGIWRLLAHRVGQEVLRPPRAEGFFSVRDGIILFQLRRMIGDTVFEFYGSGGYSGSADQFSYGYDRMVWVTRRPTGVTAHDTIPFEGRRAFRARRTSAGVRYEADGTRYVLEVLGDTLIYSEEGSWLRRWIRVRPTSSGQ